MIDSIASAYEDWSKESLDRWPPAIRDAFHAGAVAALDLVNRYADVVPRDQLGREAIDRLNTEAGRAIVRACGGSR